MAFLNLCSSQSLNCGFVPANTLRNAGKKALRKFRYSDVCTISIESLSSVASCSFSPVPAIHVSLFAVSDLSDPQIWIHGSAPRACLVHFETVSSRPSSPSSDVHKRKSWTRTSLRFRCVLVRPFVCIAIFSILAFLRAQCKAGLVLSLRPVPCFLLAFAAIAGWKVDSPRLTSNSVLACSSKLLVIMLVCLCVALFRGPLSSVVSASFPSFAFRLCSSNRPLGTLVFDLSFYAFVFESFLRMRFLFPFLTLSVSCGDGFGCFYALWSTFRRPNHRVPCFEFKVGRLGRFSSLFLRT